MATYGPQSPGTLVDDASTGTVAWTNPGNAASSNDVYATAALGAFGSSHYLKATNFGFAIPAGAVIDGVTGEIEVNVSGSGGSRTLSGKLVVGNVIVGTTQSVAATLSVDTYLTLGNAANIWGASLSDTVVNQSNFGVAISAFNTQINTWSIDHIRLTVDYTPAGQPAGRRLSGFQQTRTIRIPGLQVA